MHFRLEIGRWWLQVGKTEPEPPSEQPSGISDHPTPMTVYAEPRYPLGFDSNPH